MAIILHIGFPKTATTSLQLALRANAARLEQAGILYPLVDSDFKQRYLKAVVSNQQDPRGMDGRLRQLAECISNYPGKHVVLSCEELTNVFMTDFSDASLARLHAFLRTLTPDIRLIAYVRNPAELYVAMMQERLKRLPGIVAPDSFLARFAHILSQYEKTFQVKVMVRHFKRSELIGQDILIDFFAQFQNLFEINPSTWDRVEANEALTPEILFVLDLAHRDASRREERPSRRKDVENFWRNVQRVARSAGNSGRPILFRAAAEAVLRANEADCQALTERYGVNFDRYEFLDREPSYPPSEQMSDVENIVPVDRKMAFEIWDAYRARHSDELI